MEMTGVLDVDVFKTALNMLIERHEVLRYSFNHNNTHGIEVVVNDAVRAPVTMLEASGCIIVEDLIY